MEWWSSDHYIQALAVNQSELTYRLRLIDVFRKYDVDNSGSVDQSEFDKMWHELLKLNPNCSVSKETAAMELDPDCSGEISSIESLRAEGCPSEPVAPWGKTIDDVDGEKKHL